MDPSEYDLEFFHRNGFVRRTCESCGHAFWTLGDHSRCQEAPCTPYSFLGKPAFARPFELREMRETFLSFFEQRGHTRVGRYPVVARWRNDVFFTQASIYDFQPWVTSGAIPPPANPLAISQPVLRFIDLDEVGRSGRHFTLFEMMAHHAFNRPDHEVYFKDRTVELCHELLGGTLGADPKAITYKEEEWEGGGNLGPSLSVGLAGLELATLVFMEYVRSDGALKPMPLTVVDTGYGLERFCWISKGTRTAYEACFGSAYEEVRRSYPATESAIIVDHARALNFLLTDGVVPSNSKDGYFARLLIRRLLRTLAKVPEAPSLVGVLDRVGRELEKDHPEIGDHRDDLHRVVEAEITRYGEAVERARGQIRRVEERFRREGKSIGPDELVEWYDSLGLPPDLAVQELSNPPPVPEDFYTRLAARHESEVPATDYAALDRGAPEVPTSVPETKVEYYLDPYTTAFEAHALWVQDPFVVLDRTYFYPTGGGQITDTGELAGTKVLEVLRQGPHVVHKLESPVTISAGERVHAQIDRNRRTQLMQHHTATHLLNGALREALGPHVWQAGAHKGLESARIDITHYKPLAPEEIRRVERRVNQIVREDRAVKSYFEPRSEAERRFGFTLYQGGAVPGRELRIVEVEGFDVEACGGTHCTRTAEVGLVTILGTERIQDGVVRLTYAAGERALDVIDERRSELSDVAKKLGVPVGQVGAGVDRLLARLETDRKTTAAAERTDLQELAGHLLESPQRVHSVGAITIVWTKAELGREGLMELSRILTRPAGRVAVLGGEAYGRGILFIGSSAPELSAVKLLEAARGAFDGRGGGSPSAATAVGEPGEPLERAIHAATRAAREAATAPAA